MIGPRARGFWLRLGGRHPGEHARLRFLKSEEIPNPARHSPNRASLWSKAKYSAAKAARNRKRDYDDEEWLLRKELRCAQQFPHAVRRFEPSLDTPPFTDKLTGSVPSWRGNALIKAA
jgi:hypothetical protein